MNRLCQVVAKSPKRGSAAGPWYAILSENKGVQIVRRLETYLVNEHKTIRLPTIISALDEVLPIPTFCTASHNIGTPTARSLRSGGAAATTCHCGLEGTPHVSARCARFLHGLNCQYCMMWMNPRI